MINQTGRLIAAVAFCATGLAGLLTLISPLAAAEKSAHAFEFKTAEGDTLPLKDFKGKLVLVVNTATECGFRSQIGDLQILHDRYAERGLVVLGVPSNDFGGQEPRADTEIAGYCQSTYGATYPMTAKVHVKGANAHPFYQWTTSELGITARPYWNFHKYLIGPNGEIVAWFSTPTQPTSETIIREIESRIARLPAS